MSHPAACIKFFAAVLESLRHVLCDGVDTIAFDIATRSLFGADFHKDSVQETRLPSEPFRFTCGCSYDTVGPKITKVASFLFLGDGPFPWSDPAVPATPPGTLAAAA